MNKDITKLLNQPISTADIKQRDGTGSTKLSYLASHHVIDEANRIFGFGSWSTEIQALKQVDKTQYEKPPYKPNDKAKPMVSISYLCQLKLTVKHDGEYTSHEDTGFGNGVAGDTAYGIGSCIELASKEAVTDALKRCFRFYGNKFGNSLYDKDGSGAMTDLEIEAARIVSDEDLARLDPLLEERGVDRLWLLVALKAEGYLFKTLEEMPSGWYSIATKIAYQHKITEIRSKGYDERINRCERLMAEATNIKMLDLVYAEASKAAQEQNDNKKTTELEELYKQTAKSLEEA